MNHLESLSPASHAAQRNATDAPASAAAQALVLHTHDNVATALRALDAGSQVRAHGTGLADTRVTLREPIALCHKFALRAIARDEVVVKYGEAIGRATRAIEAGEHVHTHNLVSARAR
ncbi:UxaA family hydrolase [Comamonadaceae bacterium G21597-S1]|nr:UxaA family hydrolase [Comamonadaceae bacterium G21597-S1]